MTKNFLNRCLLSFLITLLCVKRSRLHLTPAMLELLALDKLNHDENSFSSDYDFVVIGAGTAGSVVANRLTENPDWKVLVLEEGVEESILTDVPLLASTLYTTKYLVRETTESKPRNINNRNSSYCLSMKDGRCSLLRGRAVGGSSVVNFMIYSRGTPGDYDEWEAFGNPGWSYNDVLPYFIKSEKCKLPEADFRYHGRDGYLEVNHPWYDSPLTDTFLKAAEELGYETIDYHGEKTIGFSKVQATLRNGHRMSASKAYLRPIRNRANFHLSQRTTVTKIMIDSRTKTAVGVWFLKDNKKYFVKARKEIILSAGSLNSPTILMHSGVGPKDHLNSLGIRVIEDLPVGQNLMDHVNAPFLNFLVNESLTLIESKLLWNISNGIDYLTNGRGPWTLPSGSHGLGFVSLNDENSTNERPDIELVFGLSGFAGDDLGFYYELSGISDDFVRTVYGKYVGMHSFTILPLLLRPKSRGRILLKSKDPLEKPRFELNYYDHEHDVKTMILGIKKAIEIASTEAFKRYNATLIPVIYPKCQHTVYMTDPYWECLIRHITVCLEHFSGTCKMSPRDKSGVVDHRLRVHGIKSLRVVDASIIPTIISGHTVAPAYMIGEKASDMIKEDWK